MGIHEELEQMKRKINEIGKAPVLFVGSGLSMRYYGTPTWKGLLKNIAEKIGLDAEIMKDWGSNEKIATELEYYSFCYQKPDYSKKEDRRYPFRNLIKEVLDEKKKVNNEKEDEFEELGKITPAAIITTNYDDMLEKAFGEKEYGVCVGQNIALTNNDEDSRIIYKIHGSVSDVSSIVITQEDYDRFMASSKYLYAKLMTLFWEYPIVFMGYSIRDENVKNVLDTMLESMSEEQKTDFLQRVWILEYAEYKKDTVNKKVREEKFEEKKLELGKNTVKIKKFELDESYGEFYKTLASATERFQYNNLKFSISENAIDLLIKPLYQNQNNFKVVVRELLQNATDACKKGNKPIDVSLEVIRRDEGGRVFLAVSDCGVGMDWNDIKKYFLTIGQSSKTNVDDGLTGKFGIGILSVFLISNEVKVFTLKGESAPIGIRIYKKDMEKKVEKINADEKMASKVSGTYIEVQIDDEKIADNLKSGKNIGDISKVLGLDNYYVWDNARISIKCDEKEMNVEKFDKATINEVNKNLYINKMYEENESDNKSERNYPNRIALINDMMVSVSLGADGTYKTMVRDVPFFAVRTSSQKYCEDVKPDLSRSKVVIEGKLRDDIIDYIYEKEADWLLKRLENCAQSGTVSAWNLKKNVISYCSLLKKQGVFYDKNAIVISEARKSVIVVYESQTLFEGVVNETCADYCESGMNKAVLGDMLYYDEVKGIGTWYLERFIYEASGSYNGFRMETIKSLLKKLNISNVPDNNATNMWAYIMANKDVIKQAWEQRAQDGILWIDPTYQSLLHNHVNNTHTLIVEEYRGGIDGRFIEILRNKLSQKQGLIAYLKV